jgi:hypothetical protein
MKKAKTSSDSIMFVSARYFAFVGASLISCLLNVFFFKNLDKAHEYFFIAAAIVLECTKLTTCLTAITFGTLYKKFPSPKLKRKQITYFTWYGVFAALAVLASLNFSLMVTSQSDTDYQVTKNQYEAQITELQQANQNYIEYELQVPTLKQNAEQRKIESETRYDNAMQTYLPWSTENYPAGWNDYVKARDINNNEKNRWQQEQAAYTQSIAQIEKDLQEKKSSFETLVALYGSEAEIKINLATLERTRNANAGANLGFILLAQTLHVPEQQFKLIMLLFISLLIEFTILQTAPDIHITRKFLYYFRNSLPSNISIEKVLNTFDKEQIMYSDLESRLNKIEQTENSLQQTEVIPKKTKNIKEEMIIEKKLEDNIETKNKENKVDDIEIKDNEEKKVEDVFIPGLTKTFLHEDVVEKPMSPTDYTTKHQELIHKKNTEIVDDNFKSIIEKPTIVSEKPKTPIIGIDLPIQEPTNNEPKEKVIKSKETFPYRFGLTTESIKDKFILFLDSLYKNIDEQSKLPYQLRNTEEVAKEINISDKLKDVFIKRLYEMKYDKRPLIYTSKGQIVSEFSCDFLKKYTTDFIQN